MSDTAIPTILIDTLRKVSDSPDQDQREGVRYEINVRGPKGETDWLSIGMLDAANAVKQAVAPELVNLSEVIGLKNQLSAVNKAVMIALLPVALKKRAGVPQTVEELQDCLDTLCAGLLDALN